MRCKPAKTITLPFQNLHVLISCPVLDTRAVTTKAPVVIMVNLVLPLLLGFAISSINAASLPKPSLGPSISKNLTGLYTSVTNATSLGDETPSGIDPLFGVEFASSGIQLRPIACLMNVVNLMSNLALRDFNSNTGPVVIRMPSYSDVRIRSISVDSSPGRTPLRYILWGAWSYALEVMATQKFEAMLLTLGFNEQIVGFLSIEKADLQVLSLGGSDNDSRAETLKERSGTTLEPANLSADVTLVSNTTTPSLLNTITTTPSDNGCTILINPFGSTITFDELFLPILACLDYVARFPSNSPVADFTIRPTNTDAWMEFRALGSRPRTQAPVFGYRSIVHALAQLARFMGERGRFSGASVVVQVDGVSIGEGWLRKGG